MKAATLIREARIRRGFTQRQLAERAGVTQPMLSLIERGLRDPRHSTVERILRVCGRHLAAVDRSRRNAPRPGEGVDRTQFEESLRLTPDQRMRRGEQAARWMRELRRARRLS